MLTAFSRELLQVQAYFAQGDAHLGYRRLLDAAMETGNFSVYEATLSFSDWYETNKADTPGLAPRLSALLQTMEKGYLPISTQAPPLLLQAEGISKKYAHGRFQLAPLNIALKPAQIAGLVGENGNGKTTLLRLLYGELEPDSGTIRYTAAPAHADHYDIRSRTAFVPQRPLPWHGSLMNNLQYAASFFGLKGNRNKVWTEMILARMGLRAFRNYDWSRISSGYKMRFELARILLGSPQVLLLDEPLANLDVLAQQVILEDLKFIAQSARRPMAIMLSSQQLYEVEKVSDEVIFLREGKAQYQPAVTAIQKEKPLVIELETPATRESLQAALHTLAIQRLSYNGGVYLVYFEAGASLGNVLRALADAGIALHYLRDITHSSRRFFDA